MMGRDLPYECEHGFVLDWGDFGPNRNDPLDGVEFCEICTPITNEEVPLWPTGEQILYGADHHGWVWYCACGETGGPIKEWEDASAAATIHEQTHNKEN